MSGWRIVGAAPPAPTPAEEAAGLRRSIYRAMGWRHAFLRTRAPDGRTKLVPYLRTGDEEQDAYNELLAMARTPLDHRFVDDEPVAVDVELERAVEEQAEADRQLRLEAARAQRVERERANAEVLARYLRSRLAVRRRRRQLAAAAGPAMAASPRLRARLGR